MITINFETLPSDRSIKSLLLKAAKTALGSEKADLSIVVCDDDFIQSLNNEYRGVDRPTDVLSFPSEESDPETGKCYLGDIIISLQRATIQAHEANHPVESELSMLAIHGVLHLLGYDHQEIDEKKAMWRKQEDLLSSMNIVMDKFSGDE
ncbi:MAG: rRNA maturation RNase YbeY [Anaerolineaceae bacterium]